MKYAAVKLGARIVFGENIGTSGGSGESSTIIRMLAESGNTIDCFTRVLSKDFHPGGNINLCHIRDQWNEVNDRGYDALIIFGGSVNFFGGKEAPDDILAYYMINSFKGKVIFTYCDPNLLFKQIWGLIEGRDWEKNWDKSKVIIQRDDFKVITQSRNFDQVIKVHTKVALKKENIHHYPFELFPMMFPKFDPLFDDEREVDISYGGTFRTGKRERKLIDFYFGYPDNISVEVFGKIKLDQFDQKKIEGLRQPFFGEPVAFDKMINKMGEAKAHVVIGDLNYSKFDILPQRAYESIQAGCVTLIDSSYDFDKKIFGGDDFLREFAYVKDRDDVIDRIHQIKNNPQLIRDIRDRQEACVNFDYTKYCQDFSNLVKEIIQ